VDKLGLAKLIYTAILGDAWTPVHIASELKELYATSLEAIKTAALRDFHSYAFTSEGTRADSLDTVQKVLFGPVIQAGGHPSFPFLPSELREVIVAAERPCEITEIKGSINFMYLVRVC
jgi:hypothetical protein